MRNIMKLLVLTSILGLATPAFASGDGDDDGNTCGNVTRTPWLSQHTVKAKLTGIGFDVRRLVSTKNCYEVEAIDKLGALVEMYVDPATAEVLDMVHPVSHK